MPSTTTIRVCDDEGTFLFETAQFLETGNNPGLHYVLSCGLVGGLTVTLPPEFNSRLQLDGRIHVMRSVNGGAARREGGSCFFIRKWVYGNDYTEVTAVHANYLMWGRHNLDTLIFGNYFQDNQAADDFIKDFWDNNFGPHAFRAQNTAGGSDTTGADISAYVTTQAHVTAAPVIRMTFSWENTGDLIRALCDASMANGTYLTAEIVAPTESTLEIQTFVGQRGEDRRATNSFGLLFTESRGNLANALLTVDRTEEFTFAYAGGADRAYGRANEWAIDTARMAQSIFGRREVFVDASSVNDAADVLAEAQAGLRNGRPVIFATGELQETDQCIRGVHFDFGDYVTVEVRGQQYDMRLDVLDVTLQGGVETTRASFYAES